MVALGKAVGDVFAVLHDVAAFYDDPITRASGCADEFAPSVIGRASQRSDSILDVAGFHDRTSFVEAVEHATSSRWAYFNGVTSLVDGPI